MDRELAPKIDMAGPTRHDLPDLDLLPSRCAGRDAIRAALLKGQGPILLTGDPGVGKTALLRCLEAEQSLVSRWNKIEISPSTDAARFYTLIRHGFGLAPGRFDPTELTEFLAERSLDGDRWILAIDEAQNLDDALLEETRVLCNRLGAHNGFAAMMLIGQTRLAHRLIRRPTTGLASRLAEHVHLRPLDADEVGRILRGFDSSRTWPVSMVDRIHLLSEGRPARALALASRIVANAPSLTAPPASRETALPKTPARDRHRPETAISTLNRPEPLVGPSKPPIRVSEGLIEVGWQAESDSEDDTDPHRELTDHGILERATDKSSESEERINDRYAALQAWQESAANQGRHPEAPSPKVSQETDKSVVEVGVQPASPLATNPNVWADEEHGLTPYSRLFSRLKEENEAV